MKCRRSDLALALFVALAFQRPSGAELTPPVPLRTPLLLVPEETAGSGLAPEAKIQITIDERGVVRKVEVLSITPSTEYDELFRERLVTTLSRWRYAPQRRDGVAEATTLTWRESFPSRPGEPPGTSAPHAGTTDASGALAGSDAETRRSAILALPERQRLRLLEAQLMIARGLLDPQRMRTAETDQVVVRSDADDPRAATLIAENLEAIFYTLASRLLPEIDRLPERFKLQVVAYRDHASYSALLDRMPSYEWSAGYYSPAGMIAFHLEQPTDNAVMSVILHEATHAFLDRHVVRRGVAMPRWLGEGFADYVGNSQIRKGQLVPGKTLRGKYEMWRGMVARVETGGAMQLEAAKSALRAGKGLGVEELLDASPETFYGEARDLYYASSWLLVHFLRDGGNGWSTTRFPQAMVYLAEGYPPATILRELYGSTAALDAAFRSYVKGF